MYKTCITRLHSVGAALCALAALGLAACQPVAPGPAVTESRDVPAFHAIEVRGSARVDVEVGPTVSVKLTGDAAALAGLGSSVDDGTLVLEQKEKWFWRQGEGPVTARITMPKLDSMTLNGTGVSQITGISGAQLSLIVQGTGGVVAAGQIDSLKVRINGTGTMDLSHLVATAATAAVNGAGSLTVNSTASLDAEVNGVGSISYLGHPGKVESAIHGVGSISPK
jgi:Putative auto-transporter adhesin, head GIN domain